MLSYEHFFHPGVHLGPSSPCADTMQPVFPQKEWHHDNIINGIHNTKMGRIQWLMYVCAENNIQVKVEDTIFVSKEGNTLTLKSIYTVGLPSVVQM